MSQRKSDLSKEIKACTTTYSEELINTLPPTCQMLFTDKNFLEMMESFCIGYVSPQTSTASTAGIRLIPRLIPYYDLDNNVQKTDEIIGKLSVLGVTDLYSRDLRESKSLISGFLTVLNAHCTQQQLERPAIKELFASFDYKIQPQKISLQERDRLFFQKLRTFVANSGVDHRHRDFYKFAITIGLSSLLLLGKSIAAESVDDYFKSEWQVLAAHVGCEKLISRMLNYQNCNAIHNFFLKFDRAAFFELYRSLSKQQNNKFNSAFEFIVESLKWADMEYIHLIDKYIVKRNPELLSIFHSYFGGEKSRMKHVYKLMKSLPESDHPFLKLLLRYNQLTVITRKNFKFLHGAAKAVASIDDQTISYINHEDTEYIIGMKIEVRNYVLKKKGRG